MTVVVVFNYNFVLDVAANVSIDVSAGQGYSSLGTYGSSHPWNLSVYVDGTYNNDRGGSGAVSDTVSCIGAVGALAAGSHNVTVNWYGDPVITLSQAVLRILITRR
jgi:hypothetical protein